MRKASGDHRLSRKSTIMGPAGLTAVFGMGTGVTPPVWSPENRPAGFHATLAALLRWPVTITNQFLHATPREVARPPEPKPTLCHMSFDICHRDRTCEPTGSPCLAVAFACRGGEPIGVVKLLGC